MRYYIQLYRLGKGAGSRGGEASARHTGRCWGGEAERGARWRGDEVVRGASWHGWETFRLSWGGGMARSKGGGERDDIMR